MSHATGPRDGYESVGDGRPDHTVSLTAPHTRLISCPLDAGDIYIPVDGSAGSKTGECKEASAPRRDDERVEPPPKKTTSLAQKLSARVRCRKRKSEDQMSWSELAVTVLCFLLVCFLGYLISLATLRVFVSNCSWSVCLRHHQKDPFETATFGLNERTYKLETGCAFKRYVPRMQFRFLEIIHDLESKWSVLVERRRGLRCLLFDMRRYTNGSDPRCPSQYPVSLDERVGVPSSGSRLSLKYPRRFARHHFTRAPSPGFSASHGTVADPQGVGGTIASRCEHAEAFVVLRVEAKMETRSLESAAPSVVDAMLTAADPGYRPDWNVTCPGNSLVMYENVGGGLDVLQAKRRVENKDHTISDSGDTAKDQQSVPKGHIRKRSANSDTALRSLMQLPQGVSQTFDQELGVDRDYPFKPHENKKLKEDARGSKQSENSDSRVITNSFLSLPRILNENAETGLLVKSKIAYQLGTKIGLETTVQFSLKHRSGHLKNLINEKNKSDKKKSLKKEAKPFSPERTNSKSTFILNQPNSLIAGRIENTNRGPEGKRFSLKADLLDNVRPSDGTKTKAISTKFKHLRPIFTSVGGGRYSKFRLYLANLRSRRSISGARSANGNESGTNGHNIIAPTMPKHQEEVSLSAGGNDAAKPDKRTAQGAPGQSVFMETRRYFLWQGHTLRLCLIPFIP